MMLSKTKYIEKYGEEAWELERAKRSAYQKEYYQKNKERKTIKLKEHRSTEKYREWRRAYDATRRNTKKGRAHSLVCGYIETDKQKGYEKCTLTDQWIIDTIFTSKCIYCGDSNWRHLGAERIDNTKPHTPDNCVCACGICNAERADKYSVEEFIEYRKTHPRDADEQPLQLIQEVEKPDGTKIKVIKKNPLLCNRA